MARRRPMRRHNGVSAYHMYVSSLLKKANLKGKSKAQRTAAMRRVVKQAKAMAAKGFPASFNAGVAEANKKIAAKKAAGRARRGGMKKAAYKALSPAERRRIRAGGAASVSAPSSRRRRASAKPTSAASKKGTRIVKTKSGREMYFLNGKLVSKAKYMAAVGGKKASAPAKAPSRKRRTAAAKTKPASASKAVSKRASKRASKTASKPVSKRASSKGKGRRVRKNPSVAGLMATVKEFGSEIFSVQGVVGASAVGVAHGFVAPMVADYLANMFPQSVRVPVLDVEVSASSFAYTATGLVAGAALAGVGYLAGRPALGLGLGGLAFTSGLIMDTVGLVQSRGEDYGAIDNEGVVYGAIDNEGVVYGDVAYGDVAYGDVAYGDVAYGTVHSEYADAESADAEDSGSDFSTEEGQALMDGPAAWFRRFGRAPKRMTGVRSRKSRHAGRAGHRWGWLIKLVGMDKAAQIAALSPEKRLKVIASLRKQAVESLSTLMAEQASATTTELTSAARPRPNLLPGPQAMGLDLMALGAGAAQGAGGYGAVMYAGSGF